jgi:multicomponent K+:H+ antiporter subunit E
VKSFLPSTLLSTSILATWLLLNNSLAAGQIVLGLLLAVAVPLVTAGQGGKSVAGARRFGRGVVAAKLALRVLGDIVVSNIEVARRILGPESALQPRFVWVPLDIRDPRGIAVLMAVVTLTPGTVSADLSPDRRRLLVHGLHVPDEGELVATVKRRYEASLMEIFP